MTAYLADLVRIYKSDPPPTPASGRGFGRRKRLLKRDKYEVVLLFSATFNPYNPQSSGLASVSGAWGTVVKKSMPVIRSNSLTESISSTEGFLPFAER